MASTLNPYLTFQGTAREAMEFYRDVFGGELTLTTFADFGLADIPNPEYITVSYTHLTLPTSDLV